MIFLEVQTTKRSKIMGQSRKKKNRVLGKEKILDKYPVPLEKTLMHEYIETMRW